MKFLVTEENPNGRKLETVLSDLRTEIVYRCTKIAADDRNEAKQVLSNNIEILGLLTKAISLAEESTTILNKSFGPSQSGEGGTPRIGV